MRKLKFFGKGIYVLNALVAFLLVVSFILPYLPPSSFPTLSLLSLGVSPLIAINILFVLYWLLRLKKQFLVSFIVLLIAYFHFNPFFEISSQEDPGAYEKTLNIASYNVRLFNAYEKEVNPEKVRENISEFLKKENPSILCIQEFYEPHGVDFSAYPYQFIHYKDTVTRLGHAIFSKYPLIDTGTLDFEDSYNNAIYAHAIVGDDTLRVYNVHLQSLGILPSVDFLQKRGTEDIKKRITQTFVQQQEQVGVILNNKRNSPHPVLIAGDFNNTPFSYTYRQLSKGMKDAFLERGNGLGTTYIFEHYPMRIDYLLASNTFEFLRFSAIKDTFSDHYPISATVTWE